jgi:hypothetical protein
MLKNLGYVKAKNLNHFIKPLLVISCPGPLNYFRFLFSTIEIKDLMDD